MEFAVRIIYALIFFALAFITMVEVDAKQYGRATFSILLAFYTALGRPE